MESDIERRANEYRAYLRQVHGKDIPVYTAAAVSMEDGMVRLDLMGTDGVAVERLSLDRALKLIEVLQRALGQEQP